jgi:hypothetical protein
MPGLEDLIDVPIETNTRLLSKNWSPLFVRKYQVKGGWPLFISLICDLDVNDLDQVVNKAMSEFKLEEGIQSLRNLCGFLSESISLHYNNEKTGAVEGIAVLLYADKCFISSLYGDFMTHGNCKLELFSIINTMTQI